MIILSLALFLLAPSISAKNSNDGRAMESLSHINETCADTMSCIQATHQCCVNNVSFSVYFDTLPIRGNFSISQRVSYLQYSLPILSGVQSDFYRPPIL